MKLGPVNAAHARRLVRLTVEALAGVEHTYRSVQDRYGVSRATACRDLKLLREELAPPDEQQQGAPQHEQTAAA